MEFDNGYAYLQEEITELINETEQVLLSIERMGYDKSSITTLFRLVHTLKGSCGSFGFSQTAEMIHTAEHLLDLMRSGSCKNCSEFLTLMLRLCDVMKVTFEYDYSGDEAPEERNLDDIIVLTQEFSQFHAQVHLEETKEHGNYGKTTVVLKGDARGQQVRKPSQYEKILEYRGIIDSYKVTTASANNSATLTNVTVGSFKKSLLEQLSNSKKVSFDFSSITLCDEAGLSFLRAIPQIVKAQGASLDIRGVSEEIYNTAQINGLHLKKMLSPYIRTSNESKDDTRDLKQFEGTIILTPFSFQVLESSVITDVFLHLGRCGNLNVTFSMDDIPLLTDEKSEYVCKWVFTINTTYPKADLEAILCKMPSVVFWDWSREHEICKSDGVSKSLREWRENYKSFISGAKGSSDMNIQELVMALIQKGVEVNSVIDKAEDLPVSELFALYNSLFRGGESGGEKTCTID